MSSRPPSQLSQPANATNQQRLAYHNALSDMPAQTQRPPRNTPRKEQRLSLDWVLTELVSDGMVTAELAKPLQQTAQARTGAPNPLVVISEQKWKDPRAANKPLTLERLTEWLAQKTGLPYRHIDPFKIDFAAVTKLISNAYATRFRILPLSVSDSDAVFATSEPFVTEWISELSKILRVNITRVVANPRDIDNYLVEFYNLARSVEGASKQHGATLSDITNFEQLVQLGQSGNLDANDQHVVRLVDWLLQYAFEQRASDIHVEPRREFANVRFRIDGMLHQVYQIPMPVIAAMTSRIKILGRMDVVEKRRPQDGRIKTRNADGDEIELRLSTMPTAFGEKFVMRIFNPDVLVKDFSELGFSGQDRERWQSIVTNPHGIVLVTGPTGSGKTTTLYSTLKQLAAPEVNVCTIEDPIEMIEPAFNQMQVQSGIGLDFSAGVRTLLRQDPDIIMVGEIRDRETAEMAVQAALTGHLVFSTLHTNDAASAVTRLLDIGVPPYLLQSTILAVVAQRLLRTLCPLCLQKTTLEDAAWQTMIRPWQSEKPATIHEAGGCLECRMTGYKGRIGIYEIMTISNGIRELIRENADIEELRQQSYREDMKPLRINGALKVAAGVTTVEEVLSVTPPPPPELARQAQITTD